MTEQTAKAPDPQAPTAPTQVWVSIFEHRYGTDVQVYETEEIAYRRLAPTCRRFWGEAREVHQAHLGREDGEPFPADPPTEDRDAVERYFAAMGEAPQPETCEIAPHEVLGGEEALR